MGSRSSVCRSASKRPVWALVQEAFKAWPDRPHLTASTDALVPGSNSCRLTILVSFEKRGLCIGHINGDFWPSPLTTIPMASASVTDELLNRDTPMQLHSICWHKCRMAYPAPRGRLAVDVLTHLKRMYRQGRTCTTES